MTQGLIAGGDETGKAGKGEDLRLLPVTADRALPVAADVYDARPAEVRLTESILAQLEAVPAAPVPLLADKAFEGEASVTGVPSPRVASTA